MLLFELFQQRINEVPMTPGAFAQSQAAGESAGVRIGFEFEVNVPYRAIKQARQQEKKGKAPITFPSMWYREFDYDLENMYKFFSLKNPVEYNNKVYTSLYQLYNDWVSIRQENFYNQYINLAARTGTPKLKRAVGFLKAEPANSVNSRNERNHAFIYTIADRFPRNTEIQRAYRKFVREVERTSTFFDEAFGIEDPDSIDPLELFQIRPGALVSLRNFLEVDDDDDDSDDSWDVDYDYGGAVAVLRPQLEKLFGNVVTFYSYHQSRKKLDTWYIEPDGSLEPNDNDGAAEVVSPPLRLNAAMQAFSSFTSMAKQLGLYTNRYTGLHVNMSIPKKIDLLKLAIFLGEEYVLGSFGRLNSNYAQSVMRAIRGEATDDLEFDHKITDFDIGNPKSLAKLQKIVTRMMGEHFSSINFVKGRDNEYVSFRQIGGDYLNNADQVMTTMQRFVHALMIASDPNAYRNEYLTKLSKLTGGGATATKKSQSLRARKQRFNDAIINLRTKGIPVAYVYMAPRNLHSGSPVRDRRDLAIRASGNYEAGVKVITDPVLTKSILKSSGLSRNIPAQKYAALSSSPGAKLSVVFPKSPFEVDAFTGGLNNKFKDKKVEVKSPETTNSYFYYISKPDVIKGTDPLFNQIYKEYLNDFGAY
jgi:hypothetical protein